MDKSKFLAAAEKAILKGQNDKALEALETILKSDPNDLKALNRAADIYLKIENFEKAVDSLKRVGAIYTKDGFYSKAVAIYKRILKFDQGAGAKAALIEIHEKLADLYGQLGLISDAMNHFSIVVDHFDSALDHESLLKVLRKVSDLDPFNIDTQLKLAELFLAQKKVDGAIETLKRVAENVTAKQNMSDVIRVHERWVELFPSELDPLKRLVEQYLKVGEAKKALARIQLAFRANPKSAEVLELLSATFSGLKQIDKARAVDVELLKIYRQEANAEKVKELEDRIKRKGPADAPAAAPIPPALAESGSPEDLIKQLKLEPDEQKIISECEVYLKYNIPEKAFEVLKNQLTKFPKSLAIRWICYGAAQDTERTEDSKHLLSEILLLAKTQNLQSWVDLASKELKALDPEHPSLGSKPAETVVSAPPRAAPKSEAPAPSKPAEPMMRDFDVSEISIVVDEDIVGMNDVSDISLKDLRPELPPPATDDTAAEPIQLDLSSDSGNMRSGLEAIEEESSEAIDLLTEADFTSDELAQLNSQLSSDDVPVVKPAAKPAAKTVTSTPPISPTPPTPPKPAAPGAPAKAPEPARLTSDEEFEIRQALEEVSFFKEQGLQSEADVILKSLKTKFPSIKDWNNPLGAKAAKPVAPEKIAKQELSFDTLGMKMKMSVQEDDRADVDGDFFDLAGELDKELQETEAKPSAPAEVKDVFNAFKRGVAQTVAEDDWETHFDLGVAYREMGLFDDAIEEFTLVQKAPKQKVSALYQKGLCEVARENYKQAKVFFDEALSDPKLLGEQEKMSISYDLAEVLLKLNDKKRAKQLFDEINKLDPEYREVTERIKLLA